MSNGQATVLSTTASNNGGHGFTLFTAGELPLESSVASGNALNGLNVNAGVARASNSVFTNNATGLNRTAGTLLSRGNNVVSGNTTNTSGTITALGGI